EGMTRGWKLKPADSVHLATAKSLGVREFHTYDKQLSKYGSVIGFEIGMPSTMQIAAGAARRRRTR
ncbi:MAG: type II toxin-antitoxin system VapC family toxin, partial [Chloroflexi bacterium]|nr:type II toxin-antitoxin system VapC family toxin [Chloroflexota bacterium]